MVPIVHVFAENDHLGIELLEVTVGRRATGTALGGKQFHQHRHADRIGSYG
jgi:hypothetical protein